MIAGLVLAGGQGSRLGGVDKAFVTLAGQPLLAHVLARLRPQLHAIALSANGDPARFAAYGLPVLPDGAFVGKGPLAGVAAGLAWAQTSGATALLTVPVDTPFIPRTLVQALSPAPAVATWQGRQHHLVALWPVDLLPCLIALLERPGAYKVRDALALRPTRQIAFSSLNDPFLNLNTPADIAAAEHFIASEHART